MINVTTFQCILRYKLSLEDPRARLEFDYSQHKVITVKVSGVPIMEAKLVNGYVHPIMRSIDLVEEIKRLGDVPEQARYIPVSHQSHLLTALYEVPILPVH